MVSLLLPNEGSGGPPPTTSPPPSTTTTAIELPGAEQIRTGDLTAARAQSRAYLEQHPLDEQAHFLLAHTYEREGDFAAALAAYRALLEVQSNNFEAHYRIGLLQERQQQLDEAAGRSLRNTVLPPRR